MGNRYSHCCLKRHCDIAGVRLLFFFQFSCLAFHSFAVEPTTETVTAMRLICYRDNECEV